MLEKLGALTTGLKIKRYISDLKDKGFDVRRTALEELGNIGYNAKDAVPALMDAMGDEDPDVREAAAETLNKITDPKLRDLPADAEERARRLVKRMQADGARARDAVVTVMEDTGLSRREAYRLWLEEKGKPQSEVG